MSRAAYWKNKMQCIQARIKCSKMGSGGGATATYICTSDATSLSAIFETVRCVASIELALRNCPLH